MYWLPPNFAPQKISPIQYLLQLMYMHVHVRMYIVWKFTLHQLQPMYISPGLWDPKDGCGVSKESRVGEYCIYSLAESDSCMYVLTLIVPTFQCKFCNTASLQVTLSGKKGRGIYLREAHQIRKLTRASISVQPVFPERASTYMCVCVCVCVCV